jgi:serine kinase of HPr protein (carbohydrate metabolism regulator)
MTIREAAETLGCDVVCGAENLDRPLASAFGADLMSDVLTYEAEGCLLLTGMVNTHVLRTAQMLDVPCVMFVRDKRPTPEMVELAGQTGITLLCCRLTLYEACGRLYAQGLGPCRKA